MNRVRPEKQFIKEILPLLPREIQIEYLSKFSLDSSSKIKKNKFKEVRKLKATHRLQMKQFNILEQLIEIGGNYKKDKIVNDFLETIRPHFHLGDNFPTQKNIFKIQGNQWVDAKLEFAPNQVHVFQFWHSKHGQDLKDLQSRIDIFKQNPQWNGKARLVAINLEERMPEVIKKVKQKGWGNIEHYKLKTQYKDFFARALELHKRDRQPYLVIFNKFGGLVFKGTNAEFNLKTRIDQWINQNKADGEAAEEQDKYEENDPPYQDEVLDKLTFKNHLKVRFIQQLTPKFDTLGLAKGKIKAKLVKNLLISKDGVEVLARTPVLLKYVTPIENKGKIDNLIDFTQRLFHSEYLVIQEGVLYNHKEERQKFLDKVQQLFEYYYVKSPIQIARVRRVGYSTKYSVMKVKENFDTITTSRNSYDYETYQSLKNDLNKFIESELYDEDVIYSAKKASKYYLKRGFQLGAGEKIVPLAGFHKPGGEEEEIAHTKGQIQVILFWNNWNPKAQSLLNIVSKLWQKKGKEWANKIRFVNLCEDRFEDCGEFLEENVDAANTLELFYPVGSYADAFHTFDVKKSPYYVVVDTNGFITKVGKIENLEFYLAGVLNHNYEYDYKYSERQIASIFQKLDQNYIGNRFVDLGEKNKFDFKFFICSVYNQVEGRLQYQYSDHPTLKYFVRKDKEEQLNSYLEEIFSIIPQQQIKLDKIVSKTVDIPFPGKECVLCQKALNANTPQYYSPFKEEYLCVECAEFDDKTKVGIERYKYSDTVIFINGPLRDETKLKSIDKYKLGNNLKLAQGKEGDQLHNMFCNGCLQNSEGPRYIALNCYAGKYEDVNVDLCWDCFRKFKVRGSKEVKEIIKNVGEFDFNEDSPMLRVLFDLGYEDY